MQKRENFEIDDSVKITKELSTINLVVDDGEHKSSVLYKILYDRKKSYIILKEDDLDTTKVVVSLCCEFQNDTLYHILDQFYHRVIFKNKD